MFPRQRSRRVLTKSSAGRPPSQYQYGSPLGNGVRGGSGGITAYYAFNELRVATGSAAAAFCRRLPAGAHGPVE